MSANEAILVGERQDKEERLTTARQTVNNNPVLEFRDGQFLFRKTNLEGGIVERFISAAAVREAFSGVPIDTGWFNLDITCPGITRWGTGRLGEWAIAYIPPADWLLEITNEGTNEPYRLDRITTPLPGIIFFGIGTNYYAFATKTATLKPYHTIFRCPLPNVMQDGSVCWGLLKPPGASLTSIFDAWKLFITSTFNNHMANGKSKRVRDDVRIVLRDMSHAARPRHYPVHDLVRQEEDTAINLDQAVREFFETGKMPG
ncbi:MAG TPA: hypothetical protein VF543_22225 [Pyrinomonadaceae bacterium]|jgi:hypothetical protein